MGHHGSNNSGAAGEQSFYELRDGRHFRVRTPMDVLVIKESCLDRQYERVSVMIADGWNILGIGAGLGDFAVSVAQAHPHRTVYACNPCPESIAMFQDNLGLNHLENVRAFPYAINTQNGPLHLHVVPTDAGQSTTFKKLRHLCMEYHHGFTAFSHHDLVRFFQVNGFQAQCTPSPAHRHLGFVCASNLGSPNSS